MAGQGSEFIDWQSGEERHAAKSLNWIKKRHGSIPSHQAL
jgi:hypothetical protein